MIEPPQQKVARCLGRGEMSLRWTVAMSRLTFSVFQWEVQTGNFDDNVDNDNDDDNSDGDEMMMTTMKMTMMTIRLKGTSLKWRHLTAASCCSWCSLCCLACSLGPEHHHDGLEEEQDLTILDIDNRENDYVKAIVCLSSFLFSTQLSQWGQKFNPISKNFLLANSNFQRHHSKTGWLFRHQSIAMLEVSLFGFPNSK